MTITSRINKIQSEIKDVLHEKKDSWLGKAARSIRLRILHRKLHDLKTSKSKSRL